jgi:DNA replicative helicase MCM subunit Mcm2 (Cdc46/Mcm family)
MPSVNESIQIARRIIAGVKNRETTDEMLHIYIGAAMGLNPIVRPKDISDLEAKVQPLADHFTSIDEGRSGRWIRSIIRIAKALARLKLKDEVTGVEIAEAIEMRTTSDNELEIPFD